MVLALIAGSVLRTVGKNAVRLTQIPTSESDIHTILNFSN